MIDSRELMDSDDKAHFDALFHTYYPRVKHFINSLLKSDSEAEDLAQEIFIKIWLSRELFYGDLAQIKNIDAYIFRMTRNLTLNAIEHKEVKRTYAKKKLGENRQPRDTIHEDYIARETELLISMTVEKMPVQRKRIFLMSREQGFTAQQIADKLGISERTVNNQISLAMTDIKKII